MGVISDDALVGHLEADLSKRGRAVRAVRVCTDAPLFVWESEDSEGESRFIQARRGPSIGRLVALEAAMDCGVWTIPSLFLVCQADAWYGTNASVSFQRTMSRT